MAAVHIERIIEKDGELNLTGLPFRKGQLVELTISTEPAEADTRSFPTANELLHSELIGIWEKRDDIEDSSAFARRLRDKAQHRWQ